ncbi:MAG: EscS/YscS/HrcS family type III secretion system export apparatus protein [Mesorhizobium sp.]|nr:MAG: EscS/YscS/HrcS family type III secretion system export apparatus protein [Mesorhizobium sp.]
MSTATLANIAVEALKLTLVLSMPTILVATGVGLVVSLVQALTQVPVYAKRLQQFRSDVRSVSCRYLIRLSCILPLSSLPSRRRVRRA